MKKIINKKCKKNEPWLQWLTRKLNSYEAFQYFSSGEKPEDVAKDFISNNSTAITKLLENFDEEDKDTLDQFQDFFLLIHFRYHLFFHLMNQFLYLFHH